MNPIHRVSSIPTALSIGSSAHLKKRDIVRNTGNLLLIRQYLNLKDENLIDVPEMFWDQPALETWYLQTTKALEVPLRLKNLNIKLDYSLDLQRYLHELESTVGPWSDYVYWEDQNANVVQCVTASVASIGVDNHHSHYYRVFLSPLSEWRQG